MTVDDDDDLASVLFTSSSEDEVDDDSDDNKDDEDDDDDDDVICTDDSPIKQHKSTRSTATSLSLSVDRFCSAVSTTASIGGGSYSPWPTHILATSRLQLSLGCPVSAHWPC